MTTRMRFGLMLAAASLWAGAAAPIHAADNGSVDAQVTVATPCILVTPPSVDFGTLPFSTQFTGSGGVQSIHIENCGTSGEQLFGRGTDATRSGTPVWSLAAVSPCSTTSNLNEYMLRAQDGDDLSTQVALTTTNQLLEQVAASATAATDRLALDMPCTGSDGIGDVITFEAIFTATF